MRTRITSAIGGAALALAVTTVLLNGSPLAVATQGQPVLAGLNNSETESTRIWNLAPGGGSCPAETTDGGLIVCGHEDTGFGITGEGGDYGVRGVADAGGTGLFGSHTGNTGIGVHGRTGGIGSGVYGEATATGVGVFGDTTITPVDDGDLLFGTLCYLSRNPDVFQAGMNARDHYDAFGRHEGRDPNTFFDTSGYLAVNKDVAAAGVNPLEHYRHSGWHEGLDLGARFDTTLYLLHNPDVAAAGQIRSSTT